jgi:hypothetical protein
VNDRPTSDFFGALGLELHAAARRSPRRRTRLGDVGGVAAAAVLLAAAVLVALVVLRGGGDSPTAPAAVEPAPIGTVIPKGKGEPPREADSTVLATGRAPLLGPWQMETHWGKALKDPKTGEVYNPAGPCLMLYPLDPPGRTFGASGFCGPVRNFGFRKTPGFSRAQVNVPAPGRRPDGRRVRVREVLVYGRVPDRAVTVVITAPGGTRVEVAATDGPEAVPGRFYGIPLKPGLPGARINWLDKDGKPGSRGIRLMPPVTPMRHR